jgi:formate hydrogenlyase subunit 4
MSETTQSVWTAIVALVLALMIAAWAYGTYCYVQMVRHRRPGVPASSMFWPTEALSERGRAFRTRVLRSYAAFAVLALVMIVLNQLIPT